MSNTASRSSIEAIATSTGADTSAVHAAFADARRQTVLAVVAGKSAPVDVSTLARDVAAREADGTVEAPPRDGIERVHVALYHVHLPKLDDLGLVDFDADAGVVTDYDDALERLDF